MTVIVTSFTGTLTLGTTLEAYIQTVNQIPMLSSEQEFALAKRLREQDDLEAARRLVMAHLRFVVQIARSYLGYNLPLGDLIQEGNIGLMKAVKRFDPDRGVRLVSFAVHWIRAEIHDFVLRNWRIVKVATTKAQRKLFFNLRSARKRLDWLSQSETERVAQEFGVSTATVSEMEARLYGYDLSIDPLVDADDGGGSETLAPGAVLPAPHADPAELFENRDWQEQTSLQLFEALDKLDARSRAIIQRRWLSGAKPTLQELAEEFNVSAERIRQIENNALKKLKHHIHHVFPADMVARAV